MGEHDCICQDLEEGLHYELCPYRVRRLNAEFSQAEARGFAAGYAKAKEDIAEFVQREWEHEIRVSGLSEAIRALTPKREGT